MPSSLAARASAIPHARTAPGPACARYRGDRPGRLNANGRTSRPRWPRHPGPGRDLIQGRAVLRERVTQPQRQLAVGEQTSAPAGSVTVRYGKRFAEPPAGGAENPSWPTWSAAAGNRLRHSAWVQALCGPMGRSAVRCRLVCARGFVDGPQGRELTAITPGESKPAGDPLKLRLGVSGLTPLFDVGDRLPAPLAQVLSPVCPAARTGTAVSSLGAC